MNDSFKPDIDRVHRDVEFANDYRMELIKHTITLSGALLAFTVSFRPRLTHVVGPWLMWPGWIGLGLAMLGGLANMHGWDKFYISYRDFDYRGKSTEGENARNAITRWRRVAFAIQTVGFAVGVLCLAVFAAANISNVDPQ